jgi:hypothetical protein
MSAKGCSRFECWVLKAGAISEGAIFRITVATYTGVRGVRN